MDLWPEWLFQPFFNSFLRGREALPYSSTLTFLGQLHLAHRYCTLGHFIHYETRKVAGDWKRVLPGLLGRQQHHLGQGVPGSTLQYLWLFQSVVHHLIIHV